MAIQTINIGTTANDGTGDPLRTAFNKVNQNFSAVTTGLTLLGTWNASTNTPTLTDGAGTNGTYYVVSVAGSTTLGGISSWAVGDYIIRAGGAWTKFTPSAQVLAGDGTAGAPSISFAADTDVGLFRPGTNVLAATTAGVERLRINASGNVFVGNGETAVTPTENVIISSTGRASGQTDGAGGNLILRGGAGTGTGVGGFIDFVTAAPTTTGSTPNTLTSKMRLTSVGAVGIGTTSPVASALLDVQGGASFGLFANVNPSRYKVFNAAVKTGIAPSGTAVVDIVAHTSGASFFAAALAEVYFLVAFEANPSALQGHFKYDHLTVTNSTTGGSATITEIHNGSAGLFVVATGDFAITRPADRTIRITYTSQAASDNRVAVFVKGWSIASVTIT